MKFQILFLTDFISKNYVQFKLQFAKINHDEKEKWIR